MKYRWIQPRKQNKYLVHKRAEFLLFGVSWRFVQTVLQIFGLLFQKRISWSSPENLHIYWSLWNMIVYTWLLVKLRMRLFKTDRCFPFPSLTKIVFISLCNDLMLFCTDIGLYILLRGGFRGKVHIPS